jgi:YacP-like NYN domain
MLAAASTIDRVTRIAPDRDPLSGVRRLLVDGTNLLHALARGGGAQPPAALISRLRAAVPLEIAIELVFDGPTERGLKGERIAQGLKVRYGGRFTADSVLVTLVEESGPPTAADDVLVVTDDRELRFAVRRRGGRTAGTAWLIRRLDRPTGRSSAPFVGNRRPPGSLSQPAPRRVVTDARARGGHTGDTEAADTAAESEAGDTDRPAWSPGRGATTKRGNPRRQPKTR